MPEPSTGSDTARPVVASDSRLRFRLLVVLAGVLATLVFYGAPLGVWFASETMRASQGGESPGAAVEGALGGLDRWAGDDLDGVGRYLSDDHYDELHARLSQIRQQFLHDDPTYVVVATNFREVVEGRLATVTVDISLRWDMHGGAGTTFASGESRPWVFRTVLGRFGSGWKVDGFDPPDLCQVYIRC
jgi:hypothetical protein